MLDKIAPEGLVAIVRAKDARLAISFGGAIVDGGISSIEVALTTPGATGAIAGLTSRLAGRAIIGAGTVLTAADASGAIAAGAQFLVSPNFNQDVLDRAQAAGVRYVPGAMTPSEVAAILAAGVQLIKIFPAARLGPGYLRDLAGPYPHLRPIPTGGIDLANAIEFWKAGAVALGVGSVLTDGAGTRVLADVTARASQFKNLIAQAGAS